MYRTLRTRRTQHGFSLLEMIVVMALMGLAFTAFSGMMMDSAERGRETMAAQHMRRVIDATDRYIRDNAATVMASATPTTPVVITLAQLKTGNYLAGIVSNVNPYGQGYDIRVLEPTAGTLETLIVTTGGEVIREGGLRRIARQFSLDGGGYVSASTPTTATGALGGWSLTLATYGAANGGGRVAAALAFRDGQQVSDYIYRGPVPGRPELNRMGTALDMGGNQINNIGQLTVGGPVQATTVTASGRLNAYEYVALAGIVTAGGTCTPNGLLARTSTGRLASCVGGLWVQY